LYAAGVTYNQVAKMNVFPNPVKNILNFNSNNSLKNIEIFNFEGQKVLNHAFDLAQKSLDVSNFKSGFYSGLLTDQTGKQFSVKFIKE